MTFAYDVSVRASLFSSQIAQKCRIKEIEHIPTWKKFSGTNPMQEYIRNLLSGAMLARTCPCCQKKMTLDNTKNDKGGLSKNATIYRVDKSKGYIYGNMMVACKSCKDKL